MSNMKLTKQGVRDLNSLPAPKREKAVLPPENQGKPSCRHNRSREIGDRFMRCMDCGISWEV